MSIHIIILLENLRLFFYESIIRHELITRIHSFPMLYLSLLVLVLFSRLFLYRDDHDLKQIKMSGSLEIRIGNRWDRTLDFFITRPLYQPLAVGLIRIQDSFEYHLNKVIECHIRMGYFPEGSVGIESHSRWGQFNCDCMRSLGI